MTISIQQLMKQVENVRDRFYAAVYLDGDADAAVDAATADCELCDLPSGARAGGADELRQHVATRVRPSDTRIRRLSRTGDRWRVADEFRLSFTHDPELPWLLPGVPPTDRAAEVFAMSVVAVSRGRVVSCRTLWDVRTLAAQLDVSPGVSGG